MDRLDPTPTVVAGVVLPALTVAAVVWAVVAADLPWVVPFVLLVVSPVVAAVGFYGAGLWLGYDLPAPSWLPVGGRRTLGDQVPGRYHEAFSRETLSRPADDDPRPLAWLLPYVLAYTVGLAALGLFTWTALA